MSYQTKKYQNQIKKNQDLERNITIARMETLAFYAILMQLVLHLVAGVRSGDPRLLPPHLVAFLHDFLLLLLVLLGVRTAVCTSGIRIFKVVAGAGGALICVISMTLALYPQILREYLALPANIFSTDGATAWVTMTQYLGIGRLWPVALAALAGIGAWYRPINTKLEKFWKHPVGWLLILFTIAALVTLPRSPHPLITSIRLQLLESFSSTPRVVPSLRRAPLRNVSAAVPAQKTLAFKADSVIDRVFMIVLEGITSADFEKGFLNADSLFLARMHGNYAYFNNYRATNLDSYTSLIAMLTSQQVPYRAYADERLYKAVNQAENVTRSLRSLGYYTLFASTCTYHPFIPVRSDWNRIIIRGDLPSQDGWTTVGSSRMEEAVEDRAALSAIVATAVAHPKIFVMHELIYGHTTEWQAKTGVSPLKYYDRYLAELFDALKSKGLDKRSLFVVVSDHGDRAKASEAENYRVPLLIAGAGVHETVDSHFRSHLDMQGIMAAYVSGTALPPLREKMFTVGSTERWVYGELRANGDHLFIDDSTGTVPDAAGSIVPKQVQREFQQYLDMFGVHYGN